MSERAVHLLDLLDQAVVEAPEPQYVGVHRFIIDRQARMSLFEHPPASVTFPAVRLGRRPRLEAACAIKPVVWDRLLSGVLFSVHVVGPDGACRLVWEEALDPASRPSDRRWLECRVDLSGYEHQRVSLRLSTRIVEGGSGAWAWAGWGDPRVHHEPGETAVRRFERSRPHLLLITVDAMRADHLGVAGLSRVSTPALDALAAEGFWAGHARTPTPSSIGGAATILTGADPVRHRLTDEFGRLPEGLTTLPEVLARAGYCTLQVPSEDDLSDDGLGFSERFERRLPCVGQPMQDGEMAMRRLLHWLDAEAPGDRPWMAWLHLFDLHPPHTPPLEYLAAYYQHDPTAEARRFAPERVASVHGVESLAFFLSHLDLLAEGRIPHELLERLCYMIRALRGEHLLGPDLATHLPALGPPAMRHMPQAEFLSWVEQQVAACRAGTVPGQLVRWMRDVIDLLEPVSTEILAWLDGVVDARYLPAACAATASHLDSQLGRLMGALEERGLAEQTTVVLTAPHGQEIAETGMALHHHVLAEQVLRVPLVIRPAPALLPGVARGERIGGVFDLRSLPATLLEMLGVEGEMAGASQLAHVTGGRPIPEQDCFAVGVAATSICIQRGRYKLVRGLHHHHATPEWDSRPGQLLLHELEDGLGERRLPRDAHPELVERLAARLDRWWRSRSSGA